MCKYSYHSKSGTFVFDLNNDKIFQIQLPGTDKSSESTIDVSHCKAFEKNAIKINIEALELFLDEKFSLIEMGKVLKTWEMNFSSFFETVYKEVIKIEPGKTFSYKVVAGLAGNPKASRAVGSAMRKNRFPLLIPCHRVIGSDGQLVGYSGANGVTTKEKLIDWEKQAVKSPSKFRF